MISTPTALKIQTDSKGTVDARPATRGARAPAETGTAQAAIHTARVHAVVVHHRGKDMLDICLETVSRSEGVELDVVVVSNHCLEPLPERIDQHPRLHVAETGRPIGFSEANNFGVEWARRHLGPADYYYFLNNDTESRPDTLFQMVEALRRRPEAAAAGPLTLIQAFPDHLNSLGINVTDDAWGWDEGIGQRIDDYGPLPEVRPVLTVTGSAYLVDAEVYEQVGGWTEAYEWYFEDIDLGIKIWKQGREVIHVPEAEILHRVSATMTVGAERKQYFFWRNRILLALIHWPWDLLRPLLRRATYWEIAKAPWGQTRLQRKALLGALRLLPKALRLRRRLAGDEHWRRFLQPAGSVPVIRLPGGRLETAPTAEQASADDPPGAPTETPVTAEEATAQEVAVDEAPVEGTDAHTPVALPTTDFVAGRGSFEPCSGDPWQTASELHRRHASGTETSPEKERPRRVLVVGWGPLPFEDQRMNYAPGARSLQLATAVAAAGHSVCLAYARIPGAYFGEPPNLLAWWEQESFLVLQMGLPTFDHPGALEGLVEAFDPEVVVGAAPRPALRAIQIAGDRPVWVDLFGDPMAEAQAKDQAQPEDEDGDHLNAYWQLLHRLLARGDAFSGVSERQRYATIGQLGVFGRLNRATAGRELVYVVPCAAVAESTADADDSNGKPTDVSWIEELSESYQGAFLALWSGGFNTWCDVDTLMDGLETAMAEEPSLRFVATGGAVDNHDPVTYAHLQARVEQSPFRDRISLLGCLPKERADRLRRRADLLVVTERSLYERELGSSGRILEWLAEGRPFLCTEQSELGSLVATEGLGLTYPAGDGEALGARLVEAARDPDSLKKPASRAKAYAAEHLTPERTAEPLVRWVADASRAPDLEAEPRNYHALAKRMARAEQMEDRLHALYASRPYRALKRVRSAARKLKPGS